MTPPKLLPLEEWLKWFQINPLPAVIDALFETATVEQGVRPCVVSDITKERLFAVPGKSDNVVFSDTKDVSPTTTYTNIDDQLYRRFLTGTGGLQYMKELPDKSGKMIPIGPSVIDLCRDTASETPTGPSAEAAGGEARYAIYRTVNTILENHPDLPAMREVQFNFLPGEIIAIVDGLRLDRTHFSVNETDHGRLLIFPDQEQVDVIIDCIQGPSSPIAPERRKPMVAALLKTMTYEKKGEARQDRMESTLFWQMIGMGALTVYTTLLATGKAGPINKPIVYLFRGLFNLMKFPMDKGKGIKGWWNDLTGELRYRGLSTVLGSGTNLTEMALRGEIRAAVDSGTEAMFEKIMNRVSSLRRAASAYVEAIPGWGKEVLMQNLAFKNIAQKSGKNYIFIQVQPDDLMAGTMYRGELEKKLKNIPEEIEAVWKERGVRVILCIDEFHEAITAGKSQEELRSLLDRWKGPLAKGTLRIVGFSTPDEMLKIRYMAGEFDTTESRDFLTERQRDLVQRWEADPVKYNIRMSENIRPLLNRFLGLSAPSRTPEDMQSMLKQDIEYMRSEESVDIRIKQETLDLIVKLSESPVTGEGYVPRRAFDLLNGVIANAAENTDVDKPIEITHAAFIDYVRTTWPVVAKRFDLASSNPIAEAAGKGAPSKATPDFTRDDFVDLFKAKFQKIELTVSVKTIKTLADFAFDEWEKKGRPMETIGGHSLPSESIIDGVMARAESVAKDALKPALSEAIRKAEERRTDGKSFTDDLPVDLKSKASGK